MNPSSKPIHTGIPQHTALLCRGLFSFMFVSGGCQSEFTSQLYRRSQRPIIAAGPQVLRGGCIFLPALCSNLLPGSLVVFHLHGGSCCFISLHFLSWLDLEAGHVAETLAGQKEGNKFLFHRSGNLSSPGVWGHVRIFSLQGERQTVTGRISHPTGETHAGVKGLFFCLPGKMKPRALPNPRLDLAIEQVQVHHRKLGETLFPNKKEN